MGNLQTYLDKRGISDEQMEVTRANTRAAIDAFNLREARKARNMTRVQLVEEMGVSRSENGDIGSMSLDNKR